MSNSPKDLPTRTTPAPADEGTVEYLKQYIDASAGSANRTRFVLIVMVTASVLTLLAMWNSRPDNMTLARVTLAANAQKFYDPIDKKIILPDEKVKPLFITQDGNFNEKAFNAAKKFAEQSRARFADLDHLKRYVEFLERARVERVVNVSVPFFGIVFDVNDLGVFAGASFIIILLLFRFSLVRELRNVRLVFMRARTVEQLELCYNRLAMQQVLTNPPSLDYKPAEESFLAELRALVWDDVVPGLLYVLPLIAHLSIFINDWRTYGRVKDLYPNMGLTLTVSGVFLLLNLLLTVLCLSLGTQLNRSWRNHAQFILKYRPEGPGDLAEEASENDNSEEHNALKKPEYEHEEIRRQQIRPESKRIYIIAFLFASVFIVSTTILIVNVTRGLHTTTDTSTWVAIFTAALSAVATISTTILAWRKDRREAREGELKIAQLERELEAIRERAVLPASNQNPK